MKPNKHLEIKAKGRPDFTSLYDHLYQVKLATQKFAKHLKLDIFIAGLGAILHDIGKVATVFQERLNPTYIYTNNDEPFRHEIVSLFFISLFNKSMHPFLIEMVLSHHKSIVNDKRERGLFDLIEIYGIDGVFELHTRDYEKWMPIAVEILACFGITPRRIEIEEVKENFINVIRYCEEKVINTYDYSKWRGLLMGGDHFASALLTNTENMLKPVFNKPNLSYYNKRKHELYPLSLKKSGSRKPHTIVTASTGSGKTDFLLRRCRGRVFYTLPFTASINAMYERIKKDTESDNKYIDVRVLHSSSKIVEKDSKREIKLIQSHFGASIKVLTPHQLACIVFGTNGYESVLLDLKGCDIILDEIHTYSKNIQGIVLKIIEILKANNCRIHIGTATLPTALYNKILDILGNDGIYHKILDVLGFGGVNQVRLTNNEMDSFDRHIIHKHPSFDDKMYGVIEEAVMKNEKVLVVRNRVAHAQETWGELKSRFPNIPILLLHSRFKRGKRNEIEKELYALNSRINQPCIIISTQVVEVSLDISFDLMVTDCAPIDSLIQRFGRINRIRTFNTIGKYKPIYVLAPPKDKKEATPYMEHILAKTYEVLPDDEVLRERDIQKLIDLVYPDIEIHDMGIVSIFEKGEFNTLRKLQHQSKSVLFQELDIISTNVILSSDVDEYIKSKNEKRIMMEIPVIYHNIEKLNLPQLKDMPHRPFIINHEVYCDEIGLDMEAMKVNGSITIL